MMGLDEIVGTLEGVERGTSDILYDLFFTEERVVAAIVRYFSDVDEGKFSLTTMLFGSLPQRSQNKARTSILIQERRQSFNNKSLDEILKLHKANFEIRYEDVVSVAIRKGILQNSLQFMLQGRIKKISFGLKASQVAKAAELIGRVLPNKLSK
jgi:hypothetical protein